LAASPARKAQYIEDEEEGENDFKFRNSGLTKVSKD
jgi:hypothetical protein